MSKHDANALILLGIAVCTGSLLMVPAIASPVQGLTALESGVLLQSPLNNILSDEAKLDSPDLEGEGDTPETLQPPALAETPDPLDDTEQTEPAEPEFTGQPVDPTPATDAPMNGPADDERLAEVIDSTSISLVRLSMKHAHALYLNDTDAAAEAADELYALSSRVLAEVQMLEVSPDRAPVRDEFVRSLLAYSSAGKTLANATDTGTAESVRAAFRDLEIASDGLEVVSQQTFAVRSASTGLSTMRTATLAAETPAAWTSSADLVSVTPPEEVLALGERYTYDDPAGENMISLIAESTRDASAYEEVSANTSPTRIEAGDGRTFLLVALKSTNLGHKGDSDLYTIETPGRDAFTLEGQGLAFKPLEVPSFTSLGESFDRKLLERYESLKGYLYFDVPADFDVTSATLRVDLGDAGTPAWDLGRDFAKESGGDAVSV